MLITPPQEVPEIEEPDKNERRHKDQRVMDPMAACPISLQPGFEHIIQNPDPKQGRDQRQDQAELEKRKAELERRLLEVCSQMAFLIHYLPGGFIGNSPLRC